MSKELEAFLPFAKHHPAGLDVASAGKVREPKPPKPDIECDKSDGSGAVAFEMVEIVDEHLYKGPVDQIRQEESFRRSYDSMPDESKMRLQSQYRNSTLLMFFYSGLSFHKRNQGIPLILSYLAKIRKLDDKHAPSDSRLKSILKKIIPLSINSVGPRFSVGAGGPIGYPLIDRLRGKIEERSYETTWPMELVAYFHQQIDPPNVSWLDPALQYVRNSLRFSNFKVVWIYSRGTDKILARIPEENQKQLK